MLRRNLCLVVRKPHHCRLADRLPGSSTAFPLHMQQRSFGFRQKEEDADVEPFARKRETDDEGYGVISGMDPPESRSRPSSLGRSMNDWAAPSAGTANAAAESGGILATFTHRAVEAYTHSVDQGYGMKSGTSEQMIGATVPILGKATPKGTQFTIERSTVFDEWSYTCPEPVGWHMSKLGCTFSKFEKNDPDATDSVQMQIIKGLNVFEVDTTLGKDHATVFRGIHETFSAFELERDGFVFIARGGMTRKPKWGDHTQKTKTQYLNISAIKARFEPVIARNLNGNQPNRLFNTGFNFDTMTPEELSNMGLFRRPQSRNPTCNLVSGLSSSWLEQTFINLAMFAKLETVDVFLIDCIGLLFEPELNFTEEEIDARLTDMFGFMEEMVRKGCIQYYGISSEELAPDVPDKTYNPMPPDALCPPRFKEPYKPRPIINLYRCMAIAEKVGGGKDKHHLKFVQYPFNLTDHTAISTPLPYDANHTLKTLAKELGLTCLTYSPLVTQDNVGLMQRYHRHVLVPDLHTARLHFIDHINKALSKELEIRPLLEQKKDLVPICREIFLASLYINLQRQWGSNYYWFSQWINTQALPAMRAQIIQFRRMVDSETKEWLTEYELLCYDFIRHRQALFQHRHALKSIEQDRLIDQVCPKLKECPIFSQKCLNFATHGGDVTTSGFHQIRYFHEATDMNPTKGKDLTQDDLEKLFSEEGLSFSNYNKMHPYMLEPPVSMEQGKFSGQRSPSAKVMEPVDWAAGEWPDIPKRVGGGRSPARVGITTNPHGTSLTTMGTGARPAAPVPADVKPQHLTVVDAVTGKPKMVGQSELEMRVIKDPSLLERPGPLKDHPPTAHEAIAGKSTTQYIAPTLPLGVIPSTKQLKDPNFSEYLTQEIDTKQKGRR